ncbi:MAG: glycosyltransferase [Bryobacteraceae bacterium]
MLPNVSIVIPAYKAAAWIEATLQGVVQQTYPSEKMEIIVVDDASPDDDASVAEAYLLGMRRTRACAPTWDTRRVMPGA